MDNVHRPGAARPLRVRAAGAVRIGRPAGRTRIACPVVLATGLAASSVGAVQSPVEPLRPIEPTVQSPGPSRGAATQPLALPVAPSQAPTPGRAAPDRAGSAQAESRLSELLLEGLILDATLTPRGRDFFRSFVDAWRQLDARTRYTVTLREQPSPRQGSIVSVEFRGRAVLRSALSPNRAASSEQSEQSAQFARAAYDAVLEHEAERLLFRSPDLAPEEL